MQFKKYQHVERLGTPEVEGILNGRVYVFPKLDGTNTSVYLNDSGEIEVSSRNRVLTLGHDNAGACAALKSNENLRSFFDNHRGVRLYGEWLVPHTIRNYRDDAWHKFYVFDVLEHSGEYEYYWTYEEYVPILNSFGIDFIPLIAAMENPNAEAVMKLKNSCTFLMKDGAIGEGIVIKKYGFVNQFGRTTWAKVVNSSVNAAIKLHKPITDDSIESAIVDNFVTAELVKKEFAKIVNENSGHFENKLIGKFLGVVWYTLISEEMFNILRKFKNPKLDFGLLRRMTEERIKEIMPEVFSRGLYQVVDDRKS